MELEIVSEITNVETIAQGKGISELARLKRQYGLGHWRKKKGLAQVRLPDGIAATAEIHWYEAHGIGKVKLKIKALL